MWCFWKERYARKQSLQQHWNGWKFFLFLGKSWSLWKLQSLRKANGLMFHFSVRIWRSSNMFMGCQSWKVHRKITTILLSLRVLPIKVMRWDSIIVMTTSKEVVNPTQETKPRWQDKVVQKHKIWKNNLSSFFGPSYLIEEEREFVEQASLFFILYIFFWT